MYIWQQTNLKLDKSGVEIDNTVSALYPKLSDCLIVGFTQLLNISEVTFDDFEEQLLDENKDYKKALVKMMREELDRNYSVSSAIANCGENSESEVEIMFTVIRVTENYSDNVFIDDITDEVLMEVAEILYKIIESHENY